MSRVVSFVFKFFITFRLDTHLFSQPFVHYFVCFQFTFKGEGTVTFVAMMLEFSMAVGVLGKQGRIVKGMVTHITVDNNVYGLMVGCKFPDTSKGLFAHFTTKRSLALS